MRAEREVPVIMDIRVLRTLYAWKSGAQQVCRKLFDRGDMDFFLIQVRALAFNGRE